MNETSVIADTYYGIDNYFIKENAEANNIQKDIVEYVRIVIDREWLSLKEEKRLSNETWLLYRKISEELFNLSPKNEYEREIKRQLLKDWDEVSQYRRAREAAAIRDVPKFFWVLAIAGFVSVIVPFYVFPPRPAHLLMIATFSAFNGLVFSFILELSQPFSGVGVIEPILYERLFTDDMPPSKHG